MPTSHAASSKDFQALVFLAARQIPEGKVATYAAVARSVGRPRAARAVGNALNKNSHKSVPCHRVIRSDGSVGGFARGTREKIKILRREGVKIILNNRVAYSNVLKNIRISK